MSLLPLKQYQEDALETLRGYFRLTNQHGARTAFVLQTNRGFTDVDQLPGLPYVCIRIPTGGGKTLMACHAISITSQEFLRQEHSVVLWLVPTNTIKDQTLNALSDRNHPYRQALESTLGGRVAVMGLADALHVQRPTLDGDTVVIVSTLAALRVEDTEGRKVYDQNGALMSHFSGLPDDLNVALDRLENGLPVYSLANVLSLHRPIIIVDEAHNARTSLSFDTLARFNPSCILEFTATPAQPPSPNPSNVLCHVSALELKAAGMIKLPIRLETNAVWQDTVRDALEKQRELEELAAVEVAGTGDILRPIVLLQAQTANQDVTVDVLEAFIIEELEIPQNQVAVETGTRHGLEGVDVLSAACPIRYIITVDKLREGWDCPFAYVLCSVRALHSPTAIEQILGRVLRMPKAERKNNQYLNHAYAFVTSPAFGSAVQTIQGALVGNGFARFEAGQSVEGGQMPLPGGWEGTPLFSTGAEGALSPAKRGERFEVPQLALRFDGELEPFDDSHFLDETWPLSTFDASISESDFSLPSAQRHGASVDVSATSGNLIITEFVYEVQEQLALIAPHDISTNAEMAVWLDRAIRHPDVTQVESSLFLSRAVDYLTSARGLSLADLARYRLLLRDGLAAKIDGYRQQRRATAFQQILGITAGRPKALEVDPECVFAYDLNDYPVNEYYEGAFQFRNHYYTPVAAMNGEEVDCARLIDSLPQVRFWVRNLERAPEWAFWLQTSTDRFYPDFVAMLTDGRVLAVEYKGADRITNDDTKEKRIIGELWAARSNGRCLFALVGHTDYQQVLSEIVRPTDLPSRPAPSPPGRRLG